MERSRYVLIGLLVLSVCLNIYALSRIADLSAAVRDTRNEISRMKDSLYDALTSVGDELEKIREEARWISNLEVTPGKPTGRVQPVTLSWQVREYPVAASVTLYLRERGQVDFTPYPAQSTGGGGFKVTFDHVVQPEPPISIVLYVEGSSSKKETVIAESSGMYITGQYEYYVTMTDGREMKTTEVAPINIKQDSAGLAAPVTMEIRAQKDPLAFDIVVYEDPKPEDYYYRLQGALIRVRDGEKVVKEVDLTAERTIEVQTPQGEELIPVFEGRLEDYLTPAEVFLVLTYGEGLSSEVPIKYLMRPADIYF